MLALIEMRCRLRESRRVTVFGYARGNSRDFERILRAYLPGRREVIRMRKAQSGDFHVDRTVMFKLSGEEETVDSAIQAAQGGSRGMFTMVKRYASWVPGFLDDVVKEQR